MPLTSALGCTSKTQVRTDAQKLAAHKAEDIMLLIESGSGR